MVASSFCWNCKHGFVTAGACVRAATNIDFGKQVGVICLMWEGHMPEL